MKTLLLCLFALLPLLGCDSPRYQQRFPGGTHTAIPGGEDYDENEVWPDYDYGRETPEEISHCNWDEHAYSSKHLGGEYTLCQSKKGETDVFVKVENVENNDRGVPIKVCFFPVHIEDGENELVGDMECQRIGSGAIHRVIFSKSSSDASAINGVLVVKDKLYNYARPYPYYQVKGPWAFRKCMEELKGGNGDYCRSFKEKEEYLSHQF